MEAEDEVAVEFECFFDLVDFYKFRGCVCLVDASRTEDKAGDALPRELAGIAAEGDAGEGSIEPHLGEQHACELCGRGVGRGLEGFIGEHGWFHHGVEGGVLRLEGIEEALVVSEDCGYGFSREEAAVDLDGAGVGHEVHLHAAVDDADVEGGRTEERVRTGGVGESAVIVFESGDDARHVMDGVDAEVRFAAVRGFSPDGDAPAQNALACDDGAQARGFGDDGGVGVESLAKFDDTAVGEFLVDDGCEPDVAGRGDAVFTEGGDGVHHGGEAGLGVAAAAAVEAPILDKGFEGGDGHALDGHRVGVCLEDDAARRIAARDAGDDVGACWEDLLFPDLDAALLEEVPDP